MRSQDGRFWDRNKVSKVRRACQGRFEESPGEESPQSCWLLKKTGFFFFSMEKGFEEHRQHPNPVGIRYGMCRDVPARSNSAPLPKSDSGWEIAVSWLPDGINGNKLQFQSLGHQEQGDSEAASQREEMESLLEFDKNKLLMVPH